MNVVDRPRPAITRDTAPWWAALRDRRLLIQRCVPHGHLQHPPEPACMTCGSFDLEWAEASGRGTVYSYAVHHQPQVPGFDLPYVTAVADLEEGTRLVAGVDAGPDEVAIGSPVTVDFLAVDDNLTIPLFRLAGRHGDTA